MPNNESSTGRKTERWGGNQRNTNVQEKDPRNEARSSQTERSQHTDTIRIQTTTHQYKISEYQRQSKEYIGILREKNKNKSYTKNVESEWLQTSTSVKKSGYLESKPSKFSENK